MFYLQANPKNLRVLVSTPNIICKKIPRTNTKIVVSTSGICVKKVTIAAKINAMNDKWIFYAKVYWYGSNDESEIDYLVGILNSEYVSHKIKPFQTFGLFGERDIQKLPLQLQIPKYNILNPLHKEISNLSYKISL